MKTLLFSGNYFAADMFLGFCFFYFSLCFFASLDCFDQASKIDCEIANIYFIAVKHLNDASCLIDGSALQRFCGTGNDVS